MDNLPRGVEVQPSTPFKPIPAHGAAYDANQSVIGLNYMGSHLIYVFVFIILTLALFYTVGRKATTYFLGLVLLGQLVIGGAGSGVQQLTNNFKLFKG